MKKRKTCINLDDSSEIVENDNLDSVDRISTLPDTTLGVILSFLPTKNTVATSLLSKRWKFVWQMTHNLDFCNERRELAEGENLRFIEFVNRVLLLHDPGFLNKFSLVWAPNAILSQASSWIDTAIARNVRELIVRVKALEMQRLMDPKFYEMPKSVFNCESLRSLKLDSDVYFSNVNLVCLPKLEILKLVSVVFESEEAFERLINGCPMLDYLDIYHDIDYMTLFSEDVYFTYKISSMSLRRLKVDDFLCNPDPTEGVFCCTLDLEASALEYLDIKGFRTEIIVQNSLSSLVEADLDIEFPESDFSLTDVCDLFIESIRALVYAKAISLSGDIMRVLSCGTIGLSTEFNRLVKLKIRNYFCCYCSPLQEFIQSSENLEALTVIQEPTWNGKNCLHHDHSKFTAPVEVPRCFLNNLKEIVVNGYSGFEDELEMIRYILKYGSGLRVVKIGVYRSMDESTKFELLQGICKLSRKSSACEVNFDDELRSPIVMTPEGSPSVSSSDSNTRVNTSLEVGSDA